MSDQAQLYGPVGAGAPEPPAPPRKRSRWVTALAIVGGLAIAAMAVAFVVGLVGGATGGIKAKVITPPAPTASAAPAAPSTPDLPPPAAPAAPEGPKQARVGDTISLTDTDSGDSADITVNKVTYLGANIPAQDQYSDPDRSEHGRFVLITVTYRATHGTWDYNEFDWSARGADGQTYDPTIAMNDLSRYGQALNSGTISAGRTAKGTVLLDVPKVGSTLELTSGFGDAQAEWPI